MHPVSFITTEMGDDLIVSFAISASDEPWAVQSLTLLRTPKYEMFLPDYERGVHISLEGADDVDDYVQRIEYDAPARFLRIRGLSCQHDLDVRKVEPEEIERMRQVLQQMNFDRRMQFIGV